MIAGVRDTDREGEIKKEGNMCSNSDKLHILMLSILVFDAHDAILHSTSLVTTKCNPFSAIVQCTRLR